MTSVISSGGTSTSSGGSVTSQFRHLKFAPSLTTTSPSSPTRSSTIKSGAGVGGSGSGKNSNDGSSRLGIMVVGIGGANGTTMLAGITANRLGINWKGPKGEDMTTPNYNGCITQLPPRGIHGGVGYQGMIIPTSSSSKTATADADAKQHRLHLADVNFAAVGGWDIRPTKPGDALLQQQILDYDLVRQIQSEMNSTCKIFRGLYDPRFIGTSQHATATHILTEDDATTDADALRCLRADIRYFKWRHNIKGHTTVIWSASVEPNSEHVTQLVTAQQLLDSIELTEQQRDGQPLPPSLLYATAALLEGCSFVNGGSQNTLSCPGLWELAKQQLGVYCLGTDFKAGQTKFKTAAVEYLRTMGLTPRVIASSNHLGNNDMRNISTAKAVTTAKLRVKHDIFAPWQEDQLDHKVSIMFTEFINDDKRDFVEYTSLGFLSQPHTMVTYTRASDSVLCVPLMIDAAVWCDYFSCRHWPYEKVSKALAYLFKVPEGGAKGVDPGFFRQMEELKVQVFAAYDAVSGSADEIDNDVGIENADGNTNAAWSIPHNAKIVCAGLACVDMQLNQATGGDGGEGIETFQGETSIGGGR
jgi:myo-inositol-1-phosphate synthase